MQNKQINDSFSGILKINSTSENWDAFFRLEDDLVTLLPITAECKERFDAWSISNVAGERISDEWVFGFTENGQSVAFFNLGINNVSISYPIDLHPARFKAPIILQSTGPNGMDLHSFDEIEFRGGIVDLLHFPSLAIEGFRTDKQLNFRDPDLYTYVYPVHVNGVDFDLVYTISLTDLVREMGKVPDLRRDIHAVMQFKFRTPQSVDMFETYYRYALRFFQFCVGHINLNFSIRLYKYTGKMKNTILTKFNDGFVDYANDKIHCTHVIRFDALRSKLSHLFEVINETKMQPNLLFLPKRNKDLGYVYHTDITDLCVALELEYNYTNKSIVDSECTDAKALAKELNRLIDESKYSERVKNKAKSLNNGSLAKMRPSLKEKITALYDEFSVQLNIITKNIIYDNNGLPESYTDATFKKLVSKFIEIRGSAAHAGVVWNEGASIYQHLNLLVYFSILKRAGYSLDESRLILSNLFSWKFLR